jgi:hypothetical protein
MLWNDGSCSRVAVPDELADDLTLRGVHDSSNGVDYCVLMDHSDVNNDGVYDAGMLLFMVAGNRGALHRRLHVSAPHIGTDSLTVAQSVELFRGVGAHTVLAAGASRYAFNGASTCDAAYSAMDAAHSDTVAMHIAALQVLASSNDAGWQSWYLQLHGMADDTCTVDAFVSHGGGSNAVYSQAGNVATDIATRVTNTGLYTAATPATNACTLRGSDNVLGRVVNGVAAGWECTTSVSSSVVVAGRFIHIEQRRVLREAAQRTLWRDVLRAVFPMDCGPGRVADAVTGMCV